MSTSEALFAQDILQKKTAQQGRGQHRGGGGLVIGGIAAQKRKEGRGGGRPDGQDKSGHQQSAGHKKAFSNYVI